MTLDELDVGDVVWAALKVLQEEGTPLQKMSTIRAYAVQQANVVSVGKEKVCLQMCATGTLVFITPEVIRETKGHAMVLAEELAAKHGVVVGEIGRAK